MNEYDLNELLKRVTKEALNDMVEFGTPSFECRAKLDSAMAELITQVLEQDKELGFLSPNEITVVKRTRAFLMENPGMGSNDVGKIETSIILFRFFNDIDG
jgi:hypothetical protein